jgi:hypothetical protein
MVSDYTESLLEQIRMEHEINGEKPHARDTPFRHSDAGKCARYLGLKYMGIDKSDTPKSGSQFVMWLGTKLHNDWQKTRSPHLGEHAEYPVSDHNQLASGALDLFVNRAKEAKVTVECKFPSGKKFARIIGITDRGPHSKRKKPAGPDPGHVIQLALNTVGSDSERGLLFYWATSALSLFVQNSINKYYPDDQLSDEDLFIKEFWFTREQLNPIAAAELARLEQIKSIVDDGGLPPAVAIDEGFKPTEELDPVYDLETNFHCLYCDRRSACLAVADTIPTIRR